MNRCKYCGKPLTLTPEYDTCIECQGRIMREATMPQGGIATNSTQPSMNIYDDLLKIIEEAKVHNIHQDYFGCVQFEKALKRAKIEHKLVGLLNQKCVNLVHIINDKELIENHMKLLSKIDGLEKKLEELK